MSYALAAENPYGRCSNSSYGVKDFIKDSYNIVKDAYHNFRNAVSGQNQGFYKNFEKKGPEYARQASHYDAPYDAAEMAYRNTEGKPGVRAGL